MSTRIHMYTGSEECRHYEGALDINKISEEYLEDLFEEYAPEELFFEDDHGDPIGDIYTYIREAKKS